jgi:hypothetical protein
MHWLEHNIMYKDFHVLWNMYYKWNYVIYLEFSRWCPVTLYSVFAYICICIFDQLWLLVSLKEIICLNANKVSITLPTWKSTFVLL